MSKILNGNTLAGLLICALSAGHASAADWAPIKQDDHTVREVDTASIGRDGPRVTFTARHTFLDKSEYQISRHPAQYLLIHFRVDCKRRTSAQLTTEAYDEKMLPIGKQNIQQPWDLPVTPGSIDESTLDFVCEKSVR